MSSLYIDKKQPIWRLSFVVLVIVALIGAITLKVIDLQVINKEFLQKQGDARTIRNDVIAAHRGNIMDRNGQPLAISTPVKSLWLDPSIVINHPEQWQKFAQGLISVGINPEVLRNRIKEYSERKFLYIKRRMPPAEAKIILDLNISGVDVKEEYKRYYPLGEVAVHIVGLANIEEEGQEGIELAYDQWLQGAPGSQQVLKDRKGDMFSEVGINTVAEPGKDLFLSIDSDIQFLTYRALKEEVTKRQAVAGSAVVLDVETGEVLAMVSQPSYNPNNRSTLNAGQAGLKNRAITDVLEPGSTVKPFTITAALESGVFDTTTSININRCIRVDRSNKCDPVNYADVTLEKIITKSSQVGAITVGLALGEEPMLSVLSRVGFGQPIGSGFPGESAGSLAHFSRWSKSDIAAMAYGYGFHASPLQLAQAYMVFANGGIKKPISLLKVDGEVEGERVIAEEVAAAVTRMMETVVTPGGGGTGTRAYIPSYRVAGKTGTTWNYNVQRGEYDTESYTSLFAGFVPASNPRIVTIVTIHEPKGVEYGGGQVAAPVFSKIAAGVMRLLNVTPDNISEEQNSISLVNIPTTESEL